MKFEVDIRVRREDFVLEAQFAAAQGITALYGGSGSGKTTLLHAVAGLVRPEAGRIVASGQVLFDAAAGVDLRPAVRRVGLVFQELRLFPHSSVEANLLYARPRRAARLDVPEVVEALGVGDLLARRPDELSGGEAQRVALGRALLAEPATILMDEPLAAVDVGLRRQILPYLRWVHERLGMRVVYVSHGLGEILELTDEIVVLEKGRLVGHGEVFEVLGQTPRATDALAIDTPVRVEIEQPDEEGGHVRGRIGDQLVLLPFTRVHPGAPGRVAVRPEDVMLAKDRLHGVSARNQLRGTVERVSGLHGRRLVHVRVGPTEDAVLRAELTRDAMLDLGIEVGTEVVCVIKTSAFRWL